MVGEGGGGRLEIEKGEGLLFGQPVVLFAHYVKM